MKAPIVTSLLTAAIVLTAAPAATADCNTRACKKRVAERQHRENERAWAARCSDRNPRACVERAILTHRLTTDQAAWMRRIPRCESGWNPKDHNPTSGATGLYQFLPSTWATTRYAHHSIWTAKWQALAAAWMLRQGRAHEWVCK